MKRLPSIRRVAIALCGIAFMLAAAATSTAEAVDEQELHCLAITIYHEARGETREGQIAVAHVILNRRGREGFAPTICGVVKQGAGSGDGTCQFSMWCDGRAEQQNADALDDSRAIAQAALAGEGGDPTGGALWFHAKDAAPPWAQRLIPTVKIGRHQFFRPNDGGAEAR
jgi:N-acetylmuramoyl-L-alanine amidase